MSIPGVLFLYTVLRLRSQCHDRPAFSYSLGFFNLGLGKNCTVCTLTGSALTAC